MEQCLGRHQSDVCHRVRSPPLADIVTQRLSFPNILMPALYLRCLQRIFSEEQRPRAVAQSVSPPSLLHYSIWNHEAARWDSTILCLRAMENIDERTK